MKFVWIALAIGAIVLGAIVLIIIRKLRPEPPVEDIPNPKSAKDAFLKNLDRFKALLPTLH